MGMEYFVANSYKDFNWSEENIFEENNKKYVIATAKCDRCGGSGVFACRVENGSPVPHPAYNGICLKCNGAGTLHKKIRVYTATEKKNNDNAAKRRQEARETAIAEKKAKLEADSEKNLHDWYSTHNFSQEGVTYCIIGEDTYVIKDTLKNLGCRYNPILGWHSPCPIELSSDFINVPIDFNDIYTWEPQVKIANYKETAEETVKKILKEARGADTHEYYNGAIGDKIKNITAKVKSIKGFSGTFGWTNIFTFESNNALLVWFTSVDKNIKIGDIVDLSCTIKNFQEYKDQKTTVVTRCTVKPIV